MNPSLSGLAVMQSHSLYVVVHVYTICVNVYIMCVEAHTHTSYTLHPDAYLTRSLRGSTHVHENSTTVVTVSVPAADILPALCVSGSAETTTVLCV